MIELSSGHHSVFFDSPGGNQGSPASHETAENWEQGTPEVLGEDGKKRLETFSQDLVKKLLTSKNKADILAYTSKKKEGLSADSSKKFQKEATTRIDIFYQWLNGNKFFDSAGNLAEPLNSEKLNQLCSSLNISKDFLGRMPLFTPQIFTPTTSQETKTEEKKQKPIPEEQRKSSPKKNDTSSSAGGKQDLSEIQQFDAGFFEVMNQNEENPEALKKYIGEQKKSLGEKANTFLYKTSLTIFENIANSPKYKNYIQKSKLLTLLNSKNTSDMWLRRTMSAARDKRNTVYINNPLEYLDAEVLTPQLLDTKTVDSYITLLVESMSDTAEGAASKEKLGHIQTSLEGLKKEGDLYSRYNKIIKSFNSRPKKGSDLFNTLEKIKEQLPIKETLTNVLHFANTNNKEVNLEQSFEDILTWIHKKQGKGEAGRKDIEYIQANKPKDIFDRFLNKVRELDKKGTISKEKVEGYIQAIRDEVFGHLGGLPEGHILKNQYRQKFDEIKKMSDHAIRSGSWSDFIERFPDDKSFTDFMHAFEKGINEKGEIKNGVVMKGPEGYRFITQEELLGKIQRHPEELKSEEFKAFKEFVQMVYEKKGGVVQLQDIFGGGKELLGISLYLQDNPDSNLLSILPDKEKGALTSLIATKSKNIYEELSGVSLEGKNSELYIRPVFFKEFQKNCKDRGIIVPENFTFESGKSVAENITRLVSNTTGLKENPDKYTFFVNSFMEDILNPSKKSHAENDKVLQGYIQECEKKDASISKLLPQALAEELQNPRDKTIILEQTEQWLQKVELLQKELGEKLQKNPADEKIKNQYQYITYVQQQILQWQRGKTLEDAKSAVETLKDPNVQEVANNGDPTKLTDVFQAGIHVKDSKHIDNSIRQGLNGVSNEFLQKNYGFANKKELEAFLQGSGNKQKLQQLQKQLQADVQNGTLSNIEERKALLEIVGAALKRIEIRKDIAIVQEKYKDDPGAIVHAIGSVTKDIHISKEESNILIHMAMTEKYGSQFSSMQKDLHMMAPGKSMSLGTYLGNTSGEKNIGTFTAGLNIEKNGVNDYTFRDPQNRVVLAGVKIENIMGYISEIDLFGQMNMESLIPYLPQINNLVGKYSGKSFDIVNKKMDQRDVNRFLHLVGNMVGIPYSETEGMETYLKKVRNTFGSKRAMDTKLSEIGVVSTSGTFQQLALEELLKKNIIESELA